VCTACVWVQKTQLCIQQLKSGLHCKYSVVTHMWRSYVRRIGGGANFNGCPPNAGSSSTSTSRCLTTRADADHTHCRFKPCSRIHVSSHSTHNRDRTDVVTTMKVCRSWQNITGDILSSDVDTLSLIQASHNPYTHLVLCVRVALCYSRCIVFYLIHL